MLNVSFSVWAIRSQELSFELGAIQDDIESQSNPPSMTGIWKYQDKEIEIHHFRYSSVENVHFFRFEYQTIIYSGNIINFDDENSRFELYLYKENDDIRTDKSLKGWMDLNGTTIQWQNIDIQGDIITSIDIPFAKKEFKWPQKELPRSRGCYNYGPLIDYQLKTIKQVCGEEPEMGTYDGITFEFNNTEKQELDRRLIEGESACPVCDIKEQHLEYYACVKRYKSMQAEADTCQQIASGVGGIIGDGIKEMCQARLQICVKFRSATFTATKIELCPIPTIRIIKDDSNGYAGMSETEFPDSNPVIFGCIDFPVTSGLLADMNPRQASKFIVAGERPGVAWYVEWWEWVKIVLFTIAGILFIRWLLKKPPAQQEEDPDYEQFDDAEFFEEYGDFYSDETEEQNEDDLYDEMF